MRKNFWKFLRGTCFDLIVLGRYGSLSALLFRCLSLRFQERGGFVPEREELVMSVGGVGVCVKGYNLAVFGAFRG